MRLLFPAALVCAAAYGCASAPQESQKPQEPQATAAQPPEVRTTRTGSRLPSNDAGHVQGVSKDTWQDERRGLPSRGDRGN
jgi:hypothetical protein